MSFKSTVLENGLNVVSYNMPYVGTIAINIIVKAGSRYEMPEESGISHFLEHMVFKGTSNRTSSQIAKEFDAIGGHFNAYTGREQTVYYTKVLTEHMHQALEIMADILQNSLFNKGDIENELNVVLQEIAGVYDSPDDLVYEKFYASAYQNNSIGRSILGDENSLKNFETQSLKNYMKKHYIAQNICISVAGKVEHERVLESVRQLFNNFSKGQVQIFEDANYKGGLSFVKRKLEQTTIALGFESVPYTNIRDYYSVQILSFILGGGLSSRLFQRIREELSLAYTIGSFASAYFDTGIFSIYASADHKKISLLLDSLIEEIIKVQENVMEEELIRAKAQFKSSVYMAEERSEYKSEEIGKNFLVFNKYFASNEILNIVNSITTSDVKNMAHRIYASPITLSIVGEKPKEFDFDKYKL